MSSSKTPTAPTPGYVPPSAATHGLPTYSGMPIVGARPLALRETPWNPQYRIFDPFASPEDVSPYKEKYRRLRVIGATAPRTGTSSLKVALEILGLGPVDHMQSCLRDSSRTRKFIKAYETCEGGGMYDFESLFAGYQSAVDEPICSLVGHVVKYYPEAKVVCTVRDKRKWWKSMDETIGFIGWNWGHVWRKIIYWFPKLWWQTELSVAVANACRNQKRLTWGDGPDSLDSYIKYVQSLDLPKDRILYYSVEQGWGPLCEFLEVPIPEVEFPRVNDSEAFRRGLNIAMAQGFAAWAIVIGSATGAAWGVWKHRDNILRQMEHLQRAITA